MNKTKLVFIGLALALLGFLGAGAASAQDGPSLSADPASVPEAGEYTFTVTGSGFTVGSVFVLPCSNPSDSTTCDIANLTPATIEDGGFTVEVTYDVPAEGIGIGAGDAGQTESASAFISVGEDLASTGVNTSLLVILGLGLGLAGAMVFGLSRRLRTL